jgi:hypothetical protein
LLFALDANEKSKADFIYKMVSFVLERHNYDYSKSQLYYVGWLLKLVAESNLAKEKKLGFVAAHIEDFVDAYDSKFPELGLKQIESQVKRNLPTNKLL